MKKFYYLHIWSVQGFDSSCTEFDNSVHPPKIGNVGLEIDFWPADDFFEVGPAFFITERLRSFFVFRAKIFEKISFRKTISIKKGLNFEALYPDAELPHYYWKVNIEGKAGTDDFGLWDNRPYLVVSQRGLDFLRYNNVTHAEADLIDVDIDDYFQSDRKNFWLKNDPFLKRE